MTTTTRNRLIVIGLALFVVLIVVLFTIFDPKDESEVVQTPEANTPVTDLGVSGDIPIYETPSGLEPEINFEPITEGRTASLQMAELFSERYGSYSNQGSYQNLRDLLPIMTPSLRLETENFLKKVSGSGPAASYEGYTATKVSSEEIFYNENAGTALYEINLQQVKVIGTTEPEVLYPVLSVSLVQVGDDWRIDEVEWIR